jgi:hypothetical protein
MQVGIDGLDGSLLVGAELDRRLVLILPCQLSPPSFWSSDVGADSLCILVPLATAVRFV